MKKIIKVWTPSDITIEDVLRIVEGYGCDNDTLSQWQNGENQKPYEIKITVNKRQLPK